MKRSYMVVYERIAEDNWGGWAPDIGGAVGAGESLPHARKSLLEGMEIQLADLADRGLKAPAAISKAVDFSEFDLNPEQSHYEIEWLSVELPNVDSHAETTAQAA